MKRSEEIAAAEKLLVRRLPRARALVKTHGPCELKSRRASTPLSDFDALASSIVYQQLTGKVGDILYARLRDLCGGSLDPAMLAVMRRDRLRKIGLSNAKTDTVRALSQAAVGGVIDFEKLRKASDEEVIETVTVVKGIGPWTAHMFLMFQLGRLDVWPSTDYGVQKGMTLLFAENELISPKKMIELGEQFKPYRSVAAWYAWRAVDTQLPAASK